MSLRHLVTTTSLLAVACGYAHAGVITGHMVDTQGNPVRNAVFDLNPMSGSGSNVVVSGGFTDVNGNFTTTVTPDGSYKLTVYPLPPPQSSVVTKLFTDVAVGATPNNLGTMELETGRVVTGRVVNVVGTPLVSVGMEFITTPGSQPLDFTVSDTNAYGQFSVALPYGHSEMHFEPGPVPYYGGPGTAGTSHSFDLTTDLEVGDIVMPTGFVVTGAVQKQSNGNAVDDADIIVVDTTTGAPIYAANNRTDNFGFFSMTIPAGTYDFRILPRSNQHLISATIANKTVPPTSSLGTTLLSDAVEIRGKAFDSNGSPCTGVMIHVNNAVTGAPVLVADNVTISGGNYRISVPTGTFDVTFSAPNTVPFGLTTVAALPVNHNTQQDATLPSVPFFTTVGNGVAGSGGLVPVIRATGGTPRLGNTAYGIECTNGLGGGRAMIETWIGTPPVFPSAAVVMQRSMLRLEGAAGTPGVGTARFPMSIPNSSLLVGKEIRARYSIQDSAAPHSRSMTNELRATIAP